MSVSSSCNYFLVGYTCTIHLVNRYTKIALMSKVSLSDVATRAEVSRGAVSQVLNGDVRGRISEATKARIFLAMKELGYQPNRLARALSRGKTDCIGLMISGFRNPFYVALLEHTEKMLHEAGYQVLIDSSSLQETNEMSGKLQGWNVDGVLIYSPQKDLTLYLGADARDLPTVGMGTSSGRGDWVVFDIYSGALQAIEYSIKRGYKRIAHVTPCDTQRREQMDGRLAGCFDACQKAGVPLEIISIAGEDILAGGRRIGLEIAARKTKKRPHVLLCHNDAMAIGVINGLRRGKVRVPEDVAVVGFDGIDEGQLLDKPLTTVEMPIEEACRNAVALLLERIQQREATGDKISKTRVRSKKIVIPTRLLRGETA